jgi:hypothetical protein
MGHPFRRPSKPGDGDFLHHSMRVREEIIT